MLNTTILRFQLMLPLILFAALAAGIGFIMAGANYEWQGLLLVALAIGIVARFLLPHLSRLEAYGALSVVLTAGLLLRLGFSMLNLWVGVNVYDRTMDALVYHHDGIVVAQHIWRLEFQEIVPFLQWGTNFMGFFTGVIYSVIGPTIYGGFLVYALLAFFGSYFFYRAFRIAFPNGNRLLYAVCIFLFPSILYWASGIGKDALIFLCLGLVAYGSALLCEQRIRGAVPLIGGLLGALWIRPHIAVTLVLALAVAFLLGGRRNKKTAGVLSYIVVLAVVSGLVWFLLPLVLNYMGLGQLSFESAVSYLQQRQMLTYEGGGAFKTYNILHPLGFPHALITVLFRPFPWESHNLQAMVQSLEGVVLMGLILWRIKSIGRAVVFSISDRYLRYMLLYMVAYVITTTAVGNLGIVVRQRDMFLPFLFMLIAYGPLGPAPGAKSNSPGLNEGIHPLNPIRKANSLDQH